MGVDSVVITIYINKNKKIAYFYGRTRATEERHYGDIAMVYDDLSMENPVKCKNECLYKEHLCIQ